MKSRLNKIMIGMACAMAITVSSFATVAVEGTNAPVVKKEKKEKKDKVTTNAPAIKTEKKVSSVAAPMQLASATKAATTVKTVKATNAPVTIESVKTPKKASDEAWVFTMSGVGSTATSGNKNTMIGANIGIGRTGHLLFPVEAGIRQGVAYGENADTSVANGESSTIASTKAYIDWTPLSYKRADVFVGSSIGAAYGNLPLTWTVAPEAGLRYWLKKDVAMYGRAEFPYDLRNGRFNETVTYVMGVQVKF